MIITKKYIPRRTMLRGMGAALALPLLDGMVPALSALSKTAAKPVQRFGVTYIPNGMILQNWTPKAEGAAFDLPPILSPLAPFRDQMLVLSGLANQQAEPLGDGSGDHSRSAAAILTGVHPKKTEGVDLRAGVSIDQIIARELGKETQLASLQLSADAIDISGACESGYSCAYLSTISWSSPTTPLPMQADPRAVFERLFGDSDSTDPQVRLARIHENRSILDSVTQKAAQFQKGLDGRDRGKIAEYLDAVRDVERRIQKAEEQSNRELPVVAQPPGIPATFDEHAKLMFDLQVLALQCDLTRVFTYSMARESSDRSYPESGVSDAYHAITHHGGDMEKMTKVTKVAAYHVKTFAYFLEKLRSTPDGDGSLLDHSTMIYTAGMGDGNKHQQFDLPVVVMGGGAGHLKGGRHIRYPQHTPITNLYLTLIDQLDIHVEQFGDSTGRLELLGV